MACCVNLWCSKDHLSTAINVQNFSSLSSTLYKLDWVCKKTDKSLHRFCLSCLFILSLFNKNVGEINLPRKCSPFIFNGLQGKFRHKLACHWERGFRPTYNEIYTWYNQGITIWVQIYLIKFSLSVCLCVCISVRNRFPNHAYYGNEAFAGDSLGLR